MNVPSSCCRLGGGHGNIQKGTLVRMNSYCQGPKAETSSLGGRKRPWDWGLVGRQGCVARNETGEVEVVESWSHWQGPATHFEVGFYSESNMQEKKKKVAWFICCSETGLKGGQAGKQGNPLRVCWWARWEKGVVWANIVVRKWRALHWFKACLGGRVNRIWSWTGCWIWGHKMNQE